MDKFIFPRAFFITGTDTNVGKTVVSAILMAGLRAAYWKPIQSGLETMTDTQWIRQATTGLPDVYFYPETHRLSQPLSPHTAAALDGVRIHLEDFRLPSFDPYPHLIVEGAGGVMVPINERDMMADLIRHLGLPVLLVARSTLGTINHTLLSLAQLRREGIHILGVVMNGSRHESNRKAVEAFGRVRVFAEIETIGTFTASALEASFQRHFGPDEAGASSDADKG